MDSGVERGRGSRFGFDLGGIGRMKSEHHVNDLLRVGGGAENLALVSLSGLIQLAI